MPICKVCLCVLCMCVCVFVTADKACGVKFCTAVQRRPSRESHILGNFAPQKPKIGRICVPCMLVVLSNRDAMFVEYCTARGRRIGMCRYRSVPTDVQLYLFCGLIMKFCSYANMVSDAVISVAYVCACLSV